MITLIHSDKVINKFIFPGGEVHLNLDDALMTFDYSPSEILEIRADIHNSNDVMELMLFVNAFRRGRARAKIRLLLPYLPYARQDRVANFGDPLSVKVMCDIINSLDFEEVEVWDCHSDVGLALLNNVVHVPVWELLFKGFFGTGVYNIFNIGNNVLVSPDAGASKKTLKIAQKLNLPMVQASKMRDTKTGNITHTKVETNYSHLEAQENKNFIVVDDICDGGRTFLELQKVLRPLTSGKLVLFVTHGIFSNGVKLFEGVYDAVYTANPWPKVPTTREADALFKLNFDGEV